MAKVTLSVRVKAGLKAWAERRADSLDTTLSWVVEQALIEMAGDELPVEFEQRMPERRRDDDGSE